MRRFLIYMADDGEDDEVNNMILTSNRTYYVAQSGNDTNDGLTPATAFGTIEHAMDVIATLISPPSVTVTVQLLDGTIEIASTVTPPSFGGNIIVQGNAATPANVIVSIDGTSVGFLGQGNARVTLKDFALSSAAPGATGFSLIDQAIIHFGNIRFGANMTNMIAIREQGLVVADSNFAIEANCVRFVSLAGQGQFDCISRTISLSGTPAWAQQFVLVAGGYARFDGCSFGGTATGQRYAVNNNGVIFTNAGGASFLPGNVAGASAAGGQYQ